MRSRVTEYRSRSGRITGDFSRPGLLWALLLWGFAAGCADSPPSDFDTLAVAAAAESPREGTPDTLFSTLISRLSEDGGYFDTDNLISNEASYLHVLGGLDRLGVTGGAYIGVGPDQNFSYIAKIRPEIAFIVDIRRDNLLQHLFFRGLFTLSETRVEYLGLLFGREAPQSTDQWIERSPEDLVAQIDASPFAAEEAVERVLGEVQTFGLDLSPRELEFIEFVHRSFIGAGFDLQFTSHNRGPSSFYPTFRDLVLERDLEDRLGNYLASESRYRFLRQMELEGRIVPVVGDLAGDHALAEIGAVVRERGLEVSAFYTSNVEFYLFDAGTFPQFAVNVAMLPVNDRSVIIRSIFRRSHSESVPGYASTQLLERIVDLNRLWAEAQVRSYRDLIERGSIRLRGEGG